MYALHEQDTPWTWHSVLVPFVVLNRLDTMGFSPLRLQRSFLVVSKTPVAAQGQIKLVQSQQHGPVRAAPGA